MFSWYRKGGVGLIYDTIKKICKEKGMSISFVEKEAGLSNGIISKWNTSSPTIDNILAVAKVLEVPVEQIVEHASD